MQDRRVEAVSSLAVTMMIFSGSAGSLNLASDRASNRSSAGSTCPLGWVAAALRHHDRRRLDGPGSCRVRPCTRRRTPCRRRRLALKPSGSTFAVKWLDHVGGDLADPRSGVLISTSIEAACCESLILSLSDSSRSAASSSNAASIASCVDVDLRQSRLEMQRQRRAVADGVLERVAATGSRPRPAGNRTT